MKYKIRMINAGDPPAKTKKGKKMAKKGGKKRKSSSKGKRATARGRGRTAIASARVTNPKKKSRRRRRRRNPGGSDIVKGLVPLFAGGVAASLAAGLARRLPIALPVIGSASPTAGEPWSVGQYGVVALASMYLPKYAGKFVNAQMLQHGMWAIIAYKAFGGLIANRMPNMLGASDGEIVVDEQNQAWLRQGNQWVAMQGLVERSPLDGLEQRGPLDADPEFIDVEAQEMGDDLVNTYQRASGYY